MSIYRLKIVKTDYPEFKEKGYLNEYGKVVDPVHDAGMELIVECRKGIFGNHFREVITKVEIPILKIIHTYDHSSCGEYTNVGLKPNIHYYGALYARYDKDLKTRNLWGINEATYEEVDKYLKDHEDVESWNDKLMNLFHPDVLVKEREQQELAEKKREDKSIKTLINKFNKNQKKK